MTFDEWFTDNEQCAKTQKEYNIAERAWNAAKEQKDPPEGYYKMGEDIEILSISGEWKRGVIRATAKNIDNVEKETSFGYYPKNEFND